MLAGSISAGALFTLWSEAKRYHQEPFKQYAMLAGGGAAISVGQHLLKNLMNGPSR